MICMASVICTRISYCVSALLFIELTNLIKGCLDVDSFPANLSNSYDIMHGIKLKMLCFCLYYLVFDVSASSGAYR